MNMSCAEFEILLCDYLDGALDPLRKEAIEKHRDDCAVCRELARDAAGAVAFMDRAAAVEPPPELLTRIAFHIPSALPERAPFWQRWFQPVLQPKFAMGMAMTILSFSMLGRFAGIEPRQLTPADLAPARIWAALDDKVHRTWGRAVRYYESLRVVYEVKSRLDEWSEQEEEERRAAQASGDETVEGKSSR